MKSTENTRNDENILEFSSFPFFQQQVNIECWKKMKGKEHKSTLECDDQLWNSKNEEEIISSCSNAWTSL